MKQKNSVHRSPIKREFEEAMYSGGPNARERARALTISNPSGLENLVLVSQLLWQ